MTRLGNASVCAAISMTNSHAYTTHEHVTVRILGIGKRSKYEKKIHCTNKEGRETKHHDGVQENKNINMQQR